MSSGQKKKKNVDDSECVTKPVIQRLVLKGGAKRMSGLIYDEIRSIIKERMLDVMMDAAVYADSAKRSTVSINDITHALQRSNIYVHEIGQHKKKKVEK